MSGRAFRQADRRTFLTGPHQGAVDLWPGRTARGFRADGGIISVSVTET